MLAIQPINHFFFKAENVLSKNNGTKFYRVGMLPGWASKTNFIASEYLARRIRHLGKNSNGETAVVLTSSVYTSLAKLLEDHFPIVTYCADDYRSYSGWGSTENIIRSESNLMNRSAANVFVSDALRNRAVEEYGLNVEKTIVSPNATDAEFLCEDLGGDIAEPPLELANLDRPIFGVLGAASDRLDIEFLLRVAELNPTGTLLIAGPVPENVRIKYSALIEHPKVHICGPIPHSQMHRYARYFDIALIPYAKTEFNRLCSPLRLYDHLASGRPLFALNTCDQVADMSRYGVTIGTPDEIVQKIQSHAQMITSPKQLLSSHELLWKHRAHTLVENLNSIL